MIDIKDLKKLVKYARQSGITELKAEGVEFKLSPELPIKPRKGKRVDVSEQVNEVETDGPTQEELLFWSAGNVAEVKES